MSTPLRANKTCELHVHIGGCFYAEDLIRFGRDVYREVDWSGFCDRYEQAYGERPDVPRLYRDALSGSRSGADAFRRHFVYTPADGPDFHRFLAKFQFFICLARHFAAAGRASELIAAAVERHRSEGLEYVEYRAMDSRGAGNPGDFLAFHRGNAEILRRASGRGFTARYVISLPRWEPLEAYALVQRLLDESPELIDTVAGLDFCHVEEGFPPKSVRPLFDRVADDNGRCPGRSLEILYHVGESFYDKSLESAARWCHEAAELGARRLGHCLALGLDPEVAVRRRPRAHEEEPVSERLDQIGYDIAHAGGLRRYGVGVDVPALERERSELRRREAGGLVSRPYEHRRLEEIRRRQRFALDAVAKSGAVIETCPTSNLCIGGVPDPEAHPVRRFLESGVNLAVAADDPGIFDSPLAAEVDWVLRHSGMDAAGLAARLGDPRRFRLGQGREKASGGR